MKRYILLLILLLVVQTTQAIKQEIRVNQTLHIDVYSNGTDFVRNAEIRIVENTFPRGPFSIQDVCTATENKDFDFSYEMEIDVQCNLTSVQWDLGQNITQLLNNTITLIRYEEREIEDCDEAVKFNIGLQKDLSICNNKTAVLNTYSSLQSAYDVCSSEKKNLENENIEYKNKYEESDSQKFNFFIYGIIIAGILVFITGKTKLFQSPTQKQFGRG